MSLSDVVKSFNKKFKSEIITVGKKFTKVRRLSFSSPMANYMLYGGIPRGRVVEFAGAESSGKTTTALDIAANAQTLFLREYNEEVEKLQALEKPSKFQAERLQMLLGRGPLTVIFADCENTLDVEWAQKLGFDAENALIMSPQEESAEEIFEALRQMMLTGEVGLVILDSLAVMISSQAYEKSIEDKTYGGISAALTRFSKEAAMICAKTSCTFIGINQMREDISSSFRAEKTTGGRAWKHNCSVRLMFRKGPFIDENGNEQNNDFENPAGNIVKLSIAKTKICKPDRRIGYYTLRYDTGIDFTSDIIDIGIKYGVVNQEGSWFSIVNLETGELFQDENGVVKVQGKANLHSLLNDNNAVMDFVIEQINQFIES